MESAYVWNERTWLSKKIKSQCDEKLFGSSPARQGVRRRQTPDKTGDPESFFYVPGVVVEEVPLVLVEAGATGVVPDALTSGVEVTVGVEVALPDSVDVVAAPEAVLEALVAISN